MHDSRDLAGTSLVEWLWRGRALAEARQACATRSRSLRNLQDARASLAVVDRILHPTDLPLTPPSLGVARRLCRDAIQLVVSAEDATDTPRASLEAWFEAPARRARLVAAAGSEEGLERLLALLAAPVVDEAPRPEAALEHDVRGARRFLRRLLASADQPDLRVRRYLLQRGLRLALVLALALVATVALRAGAFRLRHGPDLASEATWKTSSRWSGVAPTRAFAPLSPRSFFFHTEEEAQPWIEYDLANVRPVHLVEVTNRADCCRERAIPLVVTVSGDGKSWREVARRTEPFREWRQAFQLVPARYVRFTVAGKACLHLQRIVIR